MSLVVRVYSGQDLDQVLRALAADRESSAGPVRLAIAGQGADRAGQAVDWLRHGGPRPEGVAYRERPVGGQVAFVYTNGGAAYPGMGRELLDRFPDLANDLLRRCGPAMESAERALLGRTPSLLDQIAGAAFLGCLHTDISREVLGLRPDAVIGYSSGESTALMASGVWDALADLLTESQHSGLFTHKLGGEITAVRQAWARSGITGERWQNRLVHAPRADVLAALRKEPAVHLLVVNAPTSFIVGGEAEACARAMSGLASLDIGYSLACHAPEVGEVREEWWRLHHRAAHLVPGVRFYSGAWGQAYPPTADTVARALTDQAMTTVDFARVIEQAWADGVRVFIEHGPRSICTGFVSATLGSRDHLAVALDVPEHGGLRQLAQAAAELAAAGVRVAPPSPVADAHRAYLTAHTEAHRVFLSTRARAIRTETEVRQEVDAAGRLPAGVMVRLALDAHARRGRDFEVTFHDSPPPLGERLTVEVRGRVRRCLVDARPLLTLTELPETGAINAERQPVPANAEAYDRHQVQAFAEGHPAECFGAGWATTRCHLRSPAIGPQLLLEEITAFDSGYLLAEAPSPPEALMLEGALQTLAFHLAALGCTVTRDGWRFEPVPDIAYRVRSRGPSEGRIRYEVGACEVSAAPYPTVIADVLGTVDGVAVFQVRRLGLRLVPDWPLEHQSLVGHREKPGEVFGPRAMLTFARGRVSDVFGPDYACYDGLRRGPRLPGPPFLFMTRVTALTGDRMTAEYDVPADATLPLYALMEIALQPCGWLTSYLGTHLGSDSDLLFRNLGGTWTTLADLPAAVTTMATEVELTSTARDGDVTIQSFAVRCLADGLPIAEITSTFGFFPPDAFNQPGARAQARPGTEFWPDGGRAGLGRLRSEQDVDPGAWYFRAHFFQDPVQPGSLGIDAMLQLLRFFLAERGLAGDFEPMPHGMEWRYRGQVTPATSRVTVEAEITEVGAGYAIADCALWADGERIYSVTGLGLRAVTERVLDPATDTWLRDHRPTWTDPALPMMSMADLLASALGPTVTGLRDVRVSRWLPFTGPVRLRTKVAGSSVTLLAKAETDSAFAVIASGTVLAGSAAQAPDPFPPLVDARAVPDPYASGELFHGPSLRYLVDLQQAPGGADGLLDPERGDVPPGLLHQGLLDAATHVIPHLRLWEWSPRIPRGSVAFPHHLESLNVFGPLPESGHVLVQARLAGFQDDNARRPCFDLRLSSDGRVLLAMRLVEIVLPLGRIGAAPPGQIRAFLGDRRYADGIGLSVTADGTTALRRSDVDLFDWFPGTVERTYALTTGDPLVEVAVRDHVARLSLVHPSEIGVDPALECAWPLARPHERHQVRVRRNGGEVLVD